MIDIRSGICPLCGHNEIVAGPGLRVASAGGWPLAVVGWKFGKHFTSNLKDPIGYVMPCVCRRCGFMQLFCDRAADLPIGEEYGTQLLHGTPPAV